MTEVVFLIPQSDTLETFLGSIEQTVTSNMVHFHNISITTIAGSYVDLSSINKALANADVVIYCGHGENEGLGMYSQYIHKDDVLYGNDGIVISIACKTADKLGPAIVNQQTDTFIGFDDDLVVYLKNSHIALSGFITMILSLLQTNASTGHAMHLLDTELRMIERQYRKRPHPNPDAGIIWMATHINRKGLRLLGDPNKTI